MIFILGFVASFAAALILTAVVRSVALKHQVLDVPAGDRKLHKQPTPLLGGLAVILAFDVVSAIFYFSIDLLNKNIPFKSMAAIWLASFVLGAGGAIDDKKSLPPSKNIIAVLTAVLIVVALGIGIPHITNPLGGKIALSGIISGVFVSLWILGMVYTTKLLDGVDGLASTIGSIAMLSIFALSFTPQVQQSYTALLAIIGAGSILGFLMFNWHPAKIFLGESGSTFIGFLLAVLAIIAGGKTATAFLVMGIPILDVAWVIARRIMSGQSPFRGDRGHLHFRLLDLGISQPKTVLLLATFSIIFGAVAVGLQTMGKFLSLIVLLGVMTVLGAVVVSKTSKRTRGLT